MWCFLVVISSRVRTYAHTRLVEVQPSLTLVPVCSFVFTHFLFRPFFGGKGTMTLFLARIVDAIQFHNEHG